MLWIDSGDYEQPPIGTHAARCYQCIDIGTQTGEYQGRAVSRRQVIIAWELPTVLMQKGDLAGKPFTISKFYTASLSTKANLRKDLENWRGRKFSLQELAGFSSAEILGKACMLSLTENDKGKVRVTGVMALPKGMEIPDQINPSLHFSLDAFDPEVFASITEGRKKLIMASPEYCTFSAGSIESMRKLLYDTWGHDLLQRAATAHLKKSWTDCAEEDMQKVARHLNATKGGCDECKQVLQVPAVESDPFVVDDDDPSTWEYSRLADLVALNGGAAAGILNSIRDLLPLRNPAWIVDSLVNARPAEQKDAREVLITIARKLETVVAA